MRVDVSSALFQQRAEILWYWRKRSTLVSFCTFLSQVMCVSGRAAFPRRGLVRLGERRPVGAACAHGRPPGAASLSPVIMKAEPTPVCMR